MAIFAETLRALTPLFFLMLLGAALKRVGVLKTEHIPVLNSLVLNATLPALVVYHLASAPTVSHSTWWLPLAAFAAEAIAMAIGYASGKLLGMTRLRIGALLLVAPFGNTGFLGYPITLALFPHQFTAAVLVDQIGMGIPLYTCAPLIASAFGRPAGKGTTGSQSPTDTFAFFRSPLFASIVVGAAIRLIPWPESLHRSVDARVIGIVVTHSLQYLGAGTVPLILLALGASLRPEAARTGAIPLALGCVLKLIVSPFAMWKILVLFGIHGELLSAGVMLAAMPTSVMASVLAEYHELDGDYAVGVIFITTILSALAIPFWVTVAH